MQRPEQFIHRAVVGHLRMRGMPGIVFWHTPMGMFAGGARNRKGASIQGAIMKSLGARAGVSDLIIVHQGKIFALELKAEGGRATEHQMAFIADIERAGAFTCIATGVDQAVGALEAWGLLKGSTA